MNRKLWMIRRWTLAVNSVDLGIATSFNNHSHNSFFAFFLEESGLGMLHLKKLLVLINILIISSYDPACSINFNSFLKGGFNKQAQLTAYTLYIS